MNTDRRFFVAATTALGAQLLLSACRTNAAEAGSSRSAGGDKPNTSEAAASDLAGQKDKEEEVTATEDLMREHGVIRRAIIVYREAAGRLRTKPDSVSPDALQKTAKLFRAFGEDYHERKLEEQHIFPALKRAASPAASYVEVLLAQHQRGREITDYILAASQAPKIGANARALASTLEAFARMYEAHAAREDTIVFPAWKNTMSPKQYDEIGDQFEDIERATFGKDGFDDAVQQIGAIEASLGLDNLTQFTAPPPPKVT